MDMPVNVYDIISLAISISLGLLSIGLAVFSIWLSQKFSDKSDSALDSVKELARETRTLVEVSLSQQKEFSSKMLDSIIDQTKYGPSFIEKSAQDSPNIEQLVRLRIEEAERNIAKAMDEKITELSKNDNFSKAEFSDVLKEIKSEMTALAYPTTHTFSTLPLALGASLEALQEYPAHYVLLDAIVSSGSQSVDELEMVSSDYHIPPGWEEAIEKFFDNGILEGNDDSFSVSDAYKEPLVNWTKKNKKELSTLKRYYANRSKNDAEVPVTDKEKAIGRRIIF